MDGEIVYAGMGRRFLAYLADFVVLFVFEFIIIGGLMAAGRQIEDESPAGRLALICWLGYLIVALNFAHTTVGKYLFGIEVRSTRRGQNYPRISELALRETIFRCLSFICLTGYIQPFFDVRHRSSNDLWANTVVVRRAGKPSRWVVGIFLVTTIVLLIFIALAFLLRAS